MLPSQQAMYGCERQDEINVSESVVEVLRGDVVESRHRVSVAVVDVDGVLRASSGNPALVCFARSAVKPLQALPVVEDGAADRFGFAAAELALACASHSGEPHHVAVARQMLGKIGLTESALACGPHAPLHAGSARALRRSGRAPTRLHNNCSGKHAAMLALAVSHDWPVVGYHERGHPVQQRMLAEIAQWSDVAEAVIPVAVDGCGIATFALPLERMAHAFARLGRQARREGPPRRVIEAMTAHPDLVGGSGRLCSELMHVTDGRIAVKVGAEGVYCATVPSAELGIALKVEDGAKRAAEPALIGVLERLSLLLDEERAALEAFAQPMLENTRHERVGMLRASIALEPGRVAPR
jgi:L-asparaginase II